MNWPLMSLAVLVLALALGFAWYERARPSARVVALVATLAALAALGRIAFAPLPNVTPTTDIVLLSGFALGGPPGFAVGAVGALASNVFFGQGPWTPWQMATWGAIGLGGAGLARLAGGELGRVSLAAACGAAGILYGAVLNLGAWVSFTGAETTGTLAAFYVRAIPFDAAHAVANVAFCLAFGPFLVRALRRARERLDVTWKPALPAAAALVALAVAGAAAPGTAAAASGADYLSRAQNADGGFGAAPGQGSTQLHTGWAALGLAASGRNPLDVRRRGDSIVDYLRRGTESLGDTGELERTILVLRAAGLSPRDFTGRDLVRELLSRRARDGSFGRFTGWTAFGIMALRAGGTGTGVRGAARWLERNQNRDGGWGTGPRGGTSDVDNTGAALQGLAAGGRRGSAAVRRGVAYLRERQNPDGGFALARGGGSNAQSTAWAVQGLVAVGVSPGRLRRGRTPLQYLRSLQAGDGSVRYSRTSRQTPVWVTGQAVAAFARKPFPLRPVRRRAGAAGARARRAAARRTARASPSATTAREGARTARAGGATPAPSLVGPPTPLEVRLQAPLHVLAHQAGVGLGLVL